MPTFEFTSPEGKSYTVEGPEGATKEQAFEILQTQIGQPTQKAAPLPQKAEPGLIQRNNETTIDTLAGLGAGVGDVGLGVQKLVGKTINAVASPQRTLSSLISGKKNGNVIGDWLVNDAERGKRNLDAELASHAARSPIATPVGRIGGNVAATLPVGGVLGQVATKAGLPALGTALRTGGFRTGLPAAPLLSRAGAVNMGTRMLGGGGTAIGAQTLIDGGTENAGTAGTIGALLPPGLKVLGYTGGKLAKAVKYPFQSEASRNAATILGAAGANTQDAAQAMRNKLMPVGPSILPESMPTAPQLLQNPVISQLQRTVKAMGDTQLVEREAAQNVARLRGLDRISPVSGTVQQAAENLGNSVERFALPANKQAADEVSKMYMGVDPARESAFLLPINQMDAARQTYLGPGTFGSGGSARQAIETAKRIGTQKVTTETPVPLNLPPEPISNADSLLTDIRRMGGIKLHQLRDITGESRVGKGRSLPPNLFKNAGMGIDDLATDLRAKGYDIPDDVDGGVETLRDMIRRELDGEKVYPMQAMEDEAARMSSFYDDMPETQYTKTTSIEPRAVPFEELQNLRSSIGEAANSALIKGNKREAAALGKMISEIDAGLEKVAAWRGEADEFFPGDMVKRWRDANAAHAARINRFETGPQASMFRQGGDGQRAAQGAELAGKFFNSTRSQVEDAQAFKRLAGDNNTLLPMLKNYAVTDAANQTNRLGTLSNAKFNNWRNARSGALRETMAPEDMAVLEEIGRQLKLSDAAENLGRSSGSDTVQKANNALKNGLIDNPLVSLVGGKIPLANNVLSALRESAKKTKAQKIGGLLANPEELDAAIEQYIRWKHQGLLGNDALMLGNKLAPTLYRAAPPLLSSPSSR